MNYVSSFRLAMVALIPIAALSLGLGNALAQSPPPATSATPAPAPTATPAPAASPSPAPTPPPAAAETPAPPAAAPVQTADPFGEQITLAPKTVVIVKGNANWDSAFATLTDSLKPLASFF